MCNIAGYLGNRAAAPILIEMMREQSGTCGGYYTGITTLHDGKLHTRKVLGDIEHLLAETDALSLPGNIGILHSRSNAGGDARWAQPFVTTDSKLSICLNGSAGIFRDTAATSPMWRLLHEGENEDFTTATEHPVGKYAKHPSGSYVHPSEGVTYLTEHLMWADFLPPDIALGRAFELYPSEMIGLGLSAYIEDSILFANYNFPMKCAITEEELFLASFAHALPRDRAYRTVSDLPTLSAGEVMLSGVEAHPIACDCKMAEVTPEFLTCARERILETLHKAETPLDTFRLISVTDSLFRERAKGKTMLNTRYTVTYDILTALLAEGKIEMLRLPADGAPEGHGRGIKTTKFVFRQLNG